MKRFISALLALIFLSTALISCAGDGSGSGTGDGSTDAGTVTETKAPETTGDPGPVWPEEEDLSGYSAYLFAYFTGNAPDQERIYYALSLDGYHFSPINGGNPILTSHSGTGGIRDPYIFRGQDGAYYMIATDMHADQGWNSNRNLISWRSEDLITWTDETVIPINDKYVSTKGTIRAWAPQAIWDPERGEYMIYFALCSDYTKGRTIMYYAYSPDMKTLSTSPKQLFAPSNGHDAIDADIIYHDHRYYMFVKDETAGGILLTSSDKLTEGYSWEDAKLVTPQGLAVEGSSTYRLIDGSGWLLISDAYTSGFFTMARSTDLENFTQLGANDFKFASFTPRHGSVIPITKEQFESLRSNRW